MTPILTEDQAVLEAGVLNEDHVGPITPVSRGPHGLTEAFLSSPSNCDKPTTTARAHRYTTRGPEQEGLSRMHHPPPLHHQEQEAPTGPEVQAVSEKAAERPWSHATRSHTGRKQPADGTGGRRMGAPNPCYMIIVLHTRGVYTGSRQHRQVKDWPPTPKYSDFEDLCSLYIFSVIYTVFYN